mmetsp:Transcript_29576/g.75394  ORF Transcript_29576/g.75394 Transcript_29576/m.75394 type:complete len:213 (-) Transcript_29576:58-696(-)
MQRLQSSRPWHPPRPGCVMIHTPHYSCSLSGRQAPPCALFPRTLPTAPPLALSYARGLTAPQMSSHPAPVSSPSGSVFWPNAHHLTCAGCLHQQQHSSMGNSPTPPHVSAPLGIWLPSRRVLVMSQMSGYLQPCHMLASAACLLAAGSALLPMRVHNSTSVMHAMPSRVTTATVGVPPRLFFAMVPLDWLVHISILGAELCWRARRSCICIS